MFGMNLGEAFLLDFMICTGKQKADSLFSPIKCVHLIIGVQSSLLSYAGFTGAPVVQHLHAGFSPGKAVPSPLHL